MKILAFSDWRTQSIQDAIELAKREADTVDIIVYAGDDLARFSSVGINYFSELAKYSKAGVLLAVAGNDDSSQQKEILKGNNVRDLYDQPYVYRDVAFIGVEGSTSGPGSLRHSENALRKHLESFRRKGKTERVVLVSHPPPYCILDSGIRFAELDAHDHHIGSKAVSDFVRTNPAVRLVICGHCHSQGGLDERFKQALVVNVASHDGNSSEGRMAVIDLNSAGSEASVHWLSTQHLIPPDSVRNLHSVGQIRESKLRIVGLDKISALAGCNDLFSVSEKSGLSFRFLETLQIKAEAYRDKQIVPITPL